MWPRGIFWEESAAVFCKKAHAFNKPQQSLVSMVIYRDGDEVSEVEKGLESYTLGIGE